MKQGSLIVCLALLAAATGSRPAAAEDPPAGAEAGQEPALEKARGHFEEARSLLSQGHVVRAVERLEAAVSIFECEAGESEETGVAAHWLGYALNLAERWPQALQVNGKALAMLRRLLPGDQPIVVASLNNLAETYEQLGRHRDALPLKEEALATRLRLHEGDHADVAYSMGNLATTLKELGRHADALRLDLEALAMRRRVLPEDDPALAASLNNLGYTLVTLGRPDEALPLFAEALEVKRRLYPADHAEVVTGCDNLAGVYDALGRHAEALPLREEALGMSRRLFPGSHAHLALSLSNTSGTLGRLGRHADALPLIEEALAMWRELYRGDHADIALGLNNLAGTLMQLGHLGKALSFFEQAYAMLRRLIQGDHVQLAMALGNRGGTLHALGRPADALPLEEVALAMRRRLHPGNHPETARALGNLAATLEKLGRVDRALALHREALAMRRSIYEGDHPDVARSLNNLALALDLLDRPAEALPHKEEALAMRRRLHPDDHPDVAQGLNNLAHTLWTLGRESDALDLGVESNAMYRRLYPDGHRELALGLHNVASNLVRLGRHTEAIPMYRDAVAMGARTGWVESHLSLTGLGLVLLQRRRAAEALEPLVGAVVSIEALRGSALSLGTEERAAYVASLRRGMDPFPVLVEAQLALGREKDALASLERGRGREMLDLLERGRFDAEGEALRRARVAGDESAVDRIGSASDAVRRARAQVVQCERAEARVRAGGRRTEIRAATDAAASARKALLAALGSQHRLLSEVLPETASLDSESIQALLRAGERLLVYQLGVGTSFAFVVSRTAIRVVPLREGAVALTAARVGEWVREYVEPLTRRQESAPGGSELFQALVPTEIWTELETAERVFVMGHGALHALPFEALVVGTRGGKPLYWLDEGPPVAYVASGSVLSWLRARRERQRGTPRPISLVAVGDPIFAGMAGPPAWPDQGVLIRDVVPDGQASRLGLRPGDVLVGYGTHVLTDVGSLRPALEAGAGETSVEVRVRRGTDEVTVHARPGTLGIYIAFEPPPIAGPKLLSEGPGRIAMRAANARGDLLSALPGTATEVEAIREVILEAKATGAVTTLLLGKDATEAKLFEVANNPRFLHLATHGIADETDGASFSHLALTQPIVPVPGDDGALTLNDLLTTWRGRLEGTELVVLSACDTQKGRLQRDEGVFALPWGFHFAGCPTVVATLWKVADDTTPGLMEAFYRRLVATDGADKLAALLAAKQALRKTHPHPYYWAPFVLLGDPR